MSVQIFMTTLYLQVLHRRRACLSEWWIPSRCPWWHRERLEVINQCYKGLSDKLARDIKSHRIERISYRSATPTQLEDKWCSSRACWELQEHKKSRAGFWCSFAQAYQHFCQALSPRLPSISRYSHTKERHSAGQAAWPQLTAALKEQCQSDSKQLGQWFCCA